MLEITFLLLVTRLWKISLSHLFVLDWLCCIPQLTYSSFTVASSPSCSVVDAVSNKALIHHPSANIICCGNFNAHKEWLVHSHETNDLLYQDLPQKVSSWSWSLSSGLVSLLQPWQVFSIFSSSFVDFWSFGPIGRHGFHGKIYKWMSTALTMPTGTVFVITFGMFLG